MDKLTFSQRNLIKAARCEPIERPLCGSYHWDHMVARLEALGIVRIDRGERVFVSLTPRGEALRFRGPGRPVTASVAFRDMTPEQQAVIRQRGRSEGSAPQSVEDSPPHEP